MIIVLVPKFVLIERHHHSGEMKILEEQSIFCSLIRLKKETMIKAKNSVLCILLFYVFFYVRMLCSELKDMKISVFHNQKNHTRQIYIIKTSLKIHAYKVQYIDCFRNWLATCSFSCQNEYCQVS